MKQFKIYFKQPIITGLSELSFLDSGFLGSAILDPFSFLFHNPNLLTKIVLKMRLELKEKIKRKKRSICVRTAKQF